MSERARRAVGALVARAATLATAESLTGGLIGATLTSVPGASEAYLGGAVVYATRLKTELLGVPAVLIERAGVVSAEVALAMAIGAQERTGADWAIAVTGVAGPSAQDGHAPGEVHVCVRGPGTATTAPAVHLEHHRFAGDRAAIRAQTVSAALDLLLRALAPV